MSSDSPAPLPADPGPGIPSSADPAASAAPDWVPPPEELLTYNAKLGLVLFAVYTSLYASFVLVSAFWVDWMGVLWGGVPASVWTGFGLIAFAVFLAVLYGVMARDELQGERGEA
ncbi:DUF485 domain-containing protein [Alienimonas chondri]|uniref:DUF485 domain-containing protein n=1 Tax=Alienimonas chondri TaxID=2681879 RepID=A0ABX1VCP0_9PLAN|nr:DUF485 domain-containing protein [Alienimonas chondri]NNJ25280.1 hypothetical protein [Alienimonas chondri]